MTAVEAKKKVLIVDDVPTNITQLNVLLKEEYQIFFATSGADGLKAAESQLPDLILLDVEMPGMNGYEVCERLKQNPDTLQIPVIFVTAHTDTGEEERGLQLGAVDYIHKPFSPLLVQLRVRTQLMMKAQRDQLENQVKEVTTMFKVAVALIEHAIDGGDDSTGVMIDRIIAAVRVVNEIKKRAEGIRDCPDEGGTSCIQEVQTLGEQIESGCDLLTNTLDGTIVSFQDMDRIAQQLNQIANSLSDAAALINDPERINDAAEWRQMYENIRNTFVMMDAQILFEAILSGDNIQEAMEKAREMKQESQDLFEAF